MNILHKHVDTETTLETAARNANELNSKKTALAKSALRTIICVILHAFNSTARFYPKRRNVKSTQTA